MTAFALFGLACVGAIAATARGSSSAARIMALLLTGLWAGATSLALSGGMFALALLDLPVGAAAYVLWFERRQTWQAWLVALLTARLCLHPFGVIGALEWRAYLHTINALFLASLIAVAWNGGVNELVGMGRSGLLRLRDRISNNPRLVAEAAR